MNSPKATVNVSVSSVSSTCSAISVWDSQMRELLAPLSVLQHLRPPIALWFSEFSISITWYSLNCTTVKSCYFETALLHSPFNFFCYCGGLLLVLTNTGPLSPSVNGLLKSIILLRIHLLLLNMYLQMFSFINDLVFEFLLLKMLM